MMKKIIQSFSYLVIILFVLSIFGWMAVHVNKGDKNFGFLSKPIEYLISFPDLFNQSVEEAKTFALPKTFVKTPESFESINRLSADLHVLISYSDTNETRSVVLMNLKDNSVLHKWNFDEPIQPHERIWHPLLMPDSSLVYDYKRQNLVRVDWDGKLIWEQNEIFPNHSTNLNSDGDLWVCAYAPHWQPTGLYKLNGRPTYFNDEYIAKVDGETGELLYKKSMAEILLENNLQNYLLKSGVLYDPIHINDIQPALKNTPYYQKDDIFISAKHISAVLHYRPSNNTLVQLIEGPFVSQHDVDFYNDSTLIIFNNNHYAMSNGDYQAAPKEGIDYFDVGELYSQIVAYVLTTDSFYTLGEEVFKANQIHTETEGLVEFIDTDTYFVEEQNSGILWVIKGDEVLYKNVLPSFHDGFHHLPNWTRLISYDD